MNWPLFSPKKKHDKELVVKLTSASIEEIETYILQKGNLLNGQLRGPINLKGRNENLELIYLTLSLVFEDAYKLGVMDCKSQKLKEEVEQ